MDKNIKHIVFLVLPKSTLLDVTGTFEVFNQAIEHAHEIGLSPSQTYKLHPLSIDEHKNVCTGSGLVIHCEESIVDFQHTIDTLIIPGVPNSIIQDYNLTNSTINWIKDQARTVRRICSVCTGSFFLAECGLLDGKSVTTHWEKCNLLQEKYPQIHVDESSIFIKDKNTYTSAGISSGMDLALALVEEDYGRAFALYVAKQMVLYLKRPGNQSQYSLALHYQKTDYQPIQEIAKYIQENINQVLSVEDLASRIKMSPRNFSRVFLREMSITPAKYVEKIRVETACRLLTETALSLKEISSLCGFGSPDNMRKVFIKSIEISPMEYKHHFRTAF